MYRKPELGEQRVHRHHRQDYQVSTYGKDGWLQEQCKINQIKAVKAKQLNSLKNAGKLS